jgi:hypothetical protein
MAIPEHNLIHTAVVVTPATSTDGYGDTAYDYGVGATRTAITGRFQQDSGSEKFPTGRDVNEQRWTLFTNYSGITTHDHVEWVDHPTGMVEFEVFGPPDPQYGASSFNHGQVPLRILSG